MRVLKRNGNEVEFDARKILTAISKANAAMDAESEKLSAGQVKDIVEYVTFRCEKLARPVTVEEIQDMVENQLMDSGRHELARAYIKYRQNHADRRAMTDVDEKIFSIINRSSQVAMEENSNKNPVIVTVQRDYIAGEWSRYATDKYLLPEDIAKANEAGVIHFHDSDYFVQPMHNCCLLNLEDMLQNGTNISGTHIDTPKSFSTACTVTSQIVAQVASSQFGL